MARRSTVDLLPDDVRKWLDKALIDRSFSGYEALADDLAERGFTISKSALHRHGQRFEDFLGKVREGAHRAAAIAEALPDDAGQVGDALTQMLQTQIMDVVVEMNVKPDDVKFTDLITAVAKLNASSVQQKQWAAKVKAQTREAAKAVAEVARQGGLTPETVDAIRTKILGITS